MKHLSLLLATLLYTASVYAVDPMGSHKDSGSSDSPFTMFIAALLLLPLGFLFFKIGIDGADGEKSMKTGCLGCFGMIMAIITMFLSVKSCVS